MGIIDFEMLRQSIIADYTERIDLLKKDMEGELALLGKLEGRTQTLTTKTTTQKAKAQTKSRKKAPSGDVKKPGAKERILNTKQVLSGEFTRRDLHAKVNADGGGEMPAGTFSPSVTTLLREEVLVEVKNAVGSNPATYMWKEEFDKL